MVFSHRQPILGKILRLVATALLLFLLSDCSSSPPTASKPADPDWISGPARTIDNGYIVFIGTSEDTNTERSKLKAEGLALEDLANECSLIPKGTVMEDRYSKHEGRLINSWVKVAVEFQVCDHAKNASTPEDIRQIANATFTEQLKRYQDFMASGELTAQTGKGEVPPPDEWMTEANSSSQAVASYSGPPQTQYFAYRQNLAYQKEVVVLSGPTYFVQGSPEYVYVTKNIQVQNQNITQVVASNPTLSKSTASWSHIPNRPLVPPPPSLAPNYAQTHASAINAAKSGISNMSPNNKITGTKNSNPSGNSVNPNSTNTTSPNRGRLNQVNPGRGSGGKGQPQPGKGKRKRK